MEGDADSGGTWDRPHPCNTCDKRYLRKNNLEDHVLMEHPDTDQAADIVAYKASKGRSKGSLIVQCEICAKRFRYQSDLKNHTESHFRSSKRGRTPGASGTPGTPGCPPGRKYRIIDEPVARIRHTRPCLYCGKTFLDQQVLARHESAEAIEFEREANRFEEARRNRVTQSDFEEVAHDDCHQVDRTEEEFGEEEDEEGFLEIDLSYPCRPGPPISPSLYPSPAYPPRLPIATYDATVPAPYPFPSHLQSPYPLQNHTSQYSADYSQAGPPNYPSPPPAHEDPTMVYGFLPPPPALPLPEFSQGCHRPATVVAELPDPMEERTFTVLQSKDETVSSCLVSMSPSREVLDLSMPKIELIEDDAAKEDVMEEMLTNGHTTETDGYTETNGNVETNGLVEINKHSETNGHHEMNGHSETNGHSEEVVKNVLEDTMEAVITNGFTEDVDMETEVTKPDEDLEETEIDPAKIVDTILSDILDAIVDGKKEQKVEEPSVKQGINGIDLPETDSNNAYVVKVKRVKSEPAHEDDEVEDEELVIFEPNSMPTMPEANIALTEEKKGGRGLFERGLTADDWRELEDYAELMDEEEEFGEFEDDPSFRSSSPVQFEDPNRIDCKHCGMIFNDGHVRKFHEQSHMEIEDEYDDGEMTRLFCGFCGKTFKKAQYRILHEKTHTGGLPVSCVNCNKQFRWESELKAHNKLFCTQAKPAFRSKPGPKPKPKIIKEEKEKSKEGKEGKEVKELKRPRLLDQEGWEEAPKSLPKGWKMKTRPRPAQEGQLYFIFLSPDLQVFHSRKAVIQHMQAAGTYSPEDFNLVRQLARPGPRSPEKSKTGEKLKSNTEEKLKKKLKKKIDIDWPKGKTIGGVKRGPGRPSKAEMEAREKELMRLHRESVDGESTRSSSGFRLSYKEDSDTSDKEEEGRSKIRGSKKKLQRKKRKTA